MSRKRSSSNRAFTLSILLGTVALLSVNLPEADGKAKRPDGKLYFEQRCASCHAAGGNMVEPARPLKSSKVLSNLASFKDYLSKPPGHMPYYEDVVKDPVVLQKLYDYCKKLKTIPIKQASRFEQQG